MFNCCCCASLRDFAPPVCSCRYYLRNMFLSSSQGVFSPRACTDTVQNPVYRVLILRSSLSILLELRYVFLCTSCTTNF